jgi:hypothetical protein
MMIKNRKGLIVLSHILQRYSGVGLRFVYNNLPISWLYFG